VLAQHIPPKLGVFNAQLWPVFQQDEGEGKKKTEALYDLDTSPHPRMKKHLIKPSAMTFI